MQYCLNSVGNGPRTLPLALPVWFLYKKKKNNKKNKSIKLKKKTCVIDIQLIIQNYVCQYTHTKVHGGRGRDCFFVRFCNVHILARNESIKYLFLANQNHYLISKLLYQASLSFKMADNLSFSVSLILYILIRSIKIYDFDDAG